MPTRWDVQMFVRAALIAALSFGLAWLLTAATDHGGTSWTDRAGRTLPLAPACAGLGAWAALAPVRARGEALALAALGRSHVQVAAAAVSGGAFVALVAAAVIGATPLADMSIFFPRAARASTWAWQGGGFIDSVQGLRLGADGAPIQLAAKAGATATLLPRHGRAAGAAATAFAGVALPLMLAHSLLSNPRTGRDGRPMRDDLRAILAWGGALAVSMVLFHAATVRYVPALLGAAPFVALLAFAVRRYRTSP